MDVRWLLKKTSAVVRKGPATARNILFSRFDYWPVRRLKNEALLDIPVYCVNLPAETRRRAILERQLRELGFAQVYFIDAVIGSTLDPDALVREGVYDDSTAKRYHARSLSKNEISCSLSHGICYDLIVSRGHARAMILEDDALFMPSRIDEVNLSVLPADWDVLFLNSFLKDAPPRNRVAGRIFHGDAYWGSSAAYILSEKGAKRLAADYKPVIHAADGYLGRNDLSRFMCYPDCVLNGSVCYFYNTAIPQAHHAWSFAKSKA